MIGAGAGRTGRGRRERSYRWDLRMGARQWGSARRQYNDHRGQDGKCGTLKPESAEFQNGDSPVDKTTDKTTVIFNGLFPELLVQRDLARQRVYACQRTRRTGRDGAALDSRCTPE